MSTEWTPNDYANISTVGAAALCSLMMVLFKSRCSKITFCCGIFACDRVVNDKEDESDKNKKIDENKVKESDKPSDLSETEIHPVVP